MQIIGLLSLVVPVFFWALLTVSVWVAYENCKSKNKKVWLYVSTLVLFLVWAATLILPNILIKRAAERMVIDQPIENTDVVESIELLSQ